MEEFRRGMDYEAIAYDLIERMPELVLLNADKLRVFCILSDKAETDRNKRKMYAKTEKIPAKYQPLTDADVLVTIYENNITHFTRQQKEIMILRELLKVMIDTEGDTRAVGIRDYDLNDFRQIVLKYGAEWDKEPSLFDGVER